MKKYFCIFISLLFFLLLIPLPVLASKKSGKALFSNQSSVTNHPLAILADLKYWSNPTYTRVSIEIDRDVIWEAHEIGKAAKGEPGRIYIDIKHAKSGKHIKNTNINDGLLKGVRIGQYKADVVRVVLDTKSIKSYKVFMLSAPTRLIIDVTGDSRTEISQTEESASVATGGVKTANHNSKPEVDKKAKPSKNAVLSKVRRIVVDPGHGGFDPGAVGVSGTKEKDVVLAIALKLRDLLQKELDLDVVMTRSTDVFIPLEERTAIANKVNADLFVSVHANAAPNHNASGIETYYLNLAKTEKVAQLAAKENGTTLEKVTVLQAILFDLMANYKLNDSAHLAETVQNALYSKIHTQHSDVKNLGVKQGPFYVLVGATMPSILVETAFLSNRYEETRLKDSAYQQQTAQGIFEGVRAYIKSLK